MSGLLARDAVCAVTNRFCVHGNSEVENLQDKKNKNLDSCCSTFVCPLDDRRAIFFLLSAVHLKKMHIGLISETAIYENCKINERQD